MIDKTWDETVRNAQDAFEELIHNGDELADLIDRLENILAAAENALGLAIETGSWQSRDTFDEIVSMHDEIKKELK